MRSTVSTVALALLTVLASGTMGVLGATAAGAATSSVVAPQLRIAVDDGRLDAAPGDSLSYVVSIENLGAQDAAGVTITQTVPADTEFDAAGSDGTEDSSVVSWTVDIAAAQTLTLTTSMTVGETADDVLRLATVACALTSPTGTPIVCASDSNLLPAGAIVAEGEDLVRSTVLVGGFWWIFIVGAAVIVATIAIVVVLTLRRRRVVPFTGRRSAGT